MRNRILQYSSNRKGFTLVELAVVLVIIGLIVGGTLAGTTLIEAGKIRSLLNDVDKYRAAIGSFQTKYSALPGDIRTAEVSQFWTAETGGNGNGRICAFSAEDENFRAWRHLSLASMIEGSYTGTHSSYRGVVSVNMPPSALDGMGIMFHCVDASHGNYFVTSVEFPTLAASQPTWALVLGRVEDAAHDGTWVVTSAEAIPPRQAQEIDVKADDGLPTSGQVQGGVLDANCATSSASGGAYTVAYRSGICRVAFTP